MNQQDMTDILIIGGGGREHALGWGLGRSAGAGKLFFAPGNAGTATLPRATNLPVGPEDVEQLAHYALQTRPGLVVIGPEVPLALGLADRLRGAALAVFGPGAAGARLEASKSWAKEFMARHGIPTAAQVTFEGLDPSLAYLHRAPGPYVLKADGLAAGKGVLVTSDREEALHFAREALGGHLFGAAGQRILIEEFMEGIEVSLLALCDTVSGVIIPLEPASDYKRAFDGDLGPNTGGMGAYSPPGCMTPEIRAEIYRAILQPTLTGLQAEGIDYRGIVYAGLMLTGQGPRVVEYNCRFGDPETQSLLPRLESDLLEVLRHTAEGRLASLPQLRWKPGASVGVVLAAGGYPGPYQPGMVVTGLESFDNRPARAIPWNENEKDESKPGEEQEPENNDNKESVYLFHAGTTLDPAGRVVTTGGRVFNLVATGPDIARARKRVYNILEKGRIGFAGMRYRSDIAAREIG